MMDPAETLRQAYLATAAARRSFQDDDTQAIDEYVEHAIEWLHAYAEWRSMGGFEPANGDAKARELWAMIDGLRESEEG